MQKKLRMSAQERAAFVQGIKYYQERGIPVWIDGEEADDRLWEKVFEARSDGGFYMGDFVLENVPEEGCEDDLENGGNVVWWNGLGTDRSVKKPAENPVETVREHDACYSGQSRQREYPKNCSCKRQKENRKILKEIRFDLVYNR